LLIKFDTQLFIIEAKSGKISAPANRGGIKRIKKHLKELVLDPAIQAERLAEGIRELEKEDSDCKYSIEVPFETKNIDRIVKISVTLDDFAILQSGKNAFPIDQLLDEDLPDVLSVSLSSLMTIFDILEKKTDLVHYLVRRSEIQSSVHYVGDELDLLGLYIDKGFSLGELEKGEMELQIIGLSKPINDYYIAVDSGLKAIRPKRRITQWVQDICEYLEMRQTEGWSELAYTILCMDYNDQERMENDYRKIVRNLLASGGPHENQIDTVTCQLPQWSQIGFAIVALYEEEKPYRHEKMQGAASLVFEDSGAERCVVIARDLTGNEYPYTTFGLFKNENNNFII
jgi:hypothetical protein